MKKIVMLLCLLLTVNIACAQEHIHAPSGLIDLDLNERWDVCECGERLNITEHVWERDEWGDQLCTICGAQQYLWDDGMLELCGVDEYGSSVRQLNWSAEGELLCNSASRYEYDADGHVIYAWYYQDGELFGESEFALDADGYETEIRAIEYYGGGYMSIGEFNLVGDQTMISYYQDGVLESFTRFEYTYSDDGHITNMRTYTDDTLVEELDYVLLTTEDGYINYAAKMTVWFENGTRIVYMNDERGDTISESHYDAAGNLVLALEFSTEYDENDNLRKVTTMENGVVVAVEEYALDASGWSYCAAETLYAADGSATITHYDEFGEVIE